MKLAFLCPQQRRRLEYRPASAKTVWEHCSNLPNNRASHSVTNAMIMRGNAFEAADIYVQHSRGAQPHLLARYIDTALHLIEQLADLQQPRLGIAVASISALTLQRTSHTGGDRRAIRLGLRRLRETTAQLLEQLSSTDQGANDHRRTQNVLPGLPD